MSPLPLFTLLPSASIVLSRAFMLAAISSSMSAIFELTRPRSSALFRAVSIPPSRAAASRISPSAASVAASSSAFCFASCSLSSAFDSAH